MPGYGAAVRSGRELERSVKVLAESLGLDAKGQVKVGRRIWGAERKIDVVIRNLDTRQTLGVECKVQTSPGSAEEKIPTTIEDIAAWPIPGIVVLYGDGFSEKMKAYLYSTGKAVDFDDLEMWLRLFFGLDLS